MITQVLLDCDGVLADFLSTAIERLNRATGKTFTVDEYARTVHVHSMEKPYDISVSEFWKIVEDPDDLWISLKPFPWAQKLLNYCEKMGDVTIATSPSRNPQCAAQKTQWLLENLNLHNDRLMLGKRKELLARPNTVLIDDSPKNCEKFRSHGGEAIQVPSNWNTPDLSFDDVRNAIEKWRCPMYG